MRDRRLRSFAAVCLISFSLTVLLGACNEPEIDELDIFPTDVDLQAANLNIWWDYGFGFPFDKYVKDSLTSTFTKTKFHFTSFLPPLYKIGDDLFKMMRTLSSPDLIVFDKRYLPLMIESEYLEPIPDMFSLEIQYDTLTELRSYAPDGQLYALPYGRNVTGIFYNKAAFDEVNVPYPTDGMKWEDLVELVSKLNSGRWDPIDITDYDLLVNQLNVSVYDPESSKLNTESDEWKAMIQLLLDMKPYDKEMQSNIGSFGMGKTAIAIGSLYGNSTVVKGLYSQESSLQALEVDWDVVGFPLFNERLPANDMLLIGIPTRSPYKEDAMNVLKFLLSRSAQMDSSAKGLISLREDADSLVENFGSGLEWLKGKSVPSSLMSNDRIAVPDRSLEIRVMDHLSDIRLNDIVYTVDEWIESAQDRIREKLMNYYGERLRFIEDMKQKL